MLVVLGVFCQLGWVMMEFGGWRLAVGTYTCMPVRYMLACLALVPHMTKDTIYGMHARGGIIYLYDDSMSYMQRDDVS
ncbi:MAG: hypothetical protein CMP47_10570 [Rickettsiales bacterium]|nr:hypothetical protein [Rickettsiales bacterium]